MASPLVKMHTLGHDFIPDPIHAGGLRYHGMSPLVSHVYELGLVEPSPSARPSASKPVSASPGPKASSRPGADARGRRGIREARHCTETGETKVILTALCGHGHFDMAAYDAYFRGELADLDYPVERVRASMARVPVIAG